MKRLLLTMMMVVALMVAVFVVSASAETYTAVNGSGWTWDDATLTLQKNADAYTLKFTRSSGKLTLSGFDVIPSDTETDILLDVIIPSEVQADEDTTYPIVSTAKYALRDKKIISSVKIYDGITLINERVFAGCSNMVSCELPETVTSFGYAAFENCKALTEFTIPASATTLGGNMFYGCSGLTSMTIPSTVTSMGTSVFASCTGLKSAYINIENLTKIPDSTFNTCSALETVVYPSTVTEIGASAFYKAGMTSFDLTGITTIGNYAFQWSVLPSVTIPESVTSIGKLAFQSNGLKTIIFESKTPPEIADKQGLRHDAKVTGVVYVPANGEGYTDEFFSTYFYPAKMTMKRFGGYISGIEAGEENSYTVAYSVNDIDENESVHAIVALYDANGALVAAQTVDASASSAAVTSDIVPASAKIFVLNNISAIKPLYESYKLDIDLV